MTTKMQMLLRLLPLVAGRVSLAPTCEKQEPVPRVTYKLSADGGGAVYPPFTTKKLADALRLSCEADGFVDVKDYGLCGTYWKNVTPEKEMELTKAAEELSRTCIPGKPIPVRYCNGVIAWPPAAD